MMGSRSSLGARMAMMSFSGHTPPSPLFSASSPTRRPWRTVPPLAPALLAAAITVSVQPLLTTATISSFFPCSGICPSCSAPALWAWLLMNLAAAPLTADSGRVKRIPRPGVESWSFSSAARSSPGMAKPGTREKTTSFSVSPRPR